MRREVEDSSSERWSSGEEAEVELWRMAEARGVASGRARPVRSTAWLSLTGRSRSAMCAAATGDGAD